MFLWPLWIRCTRRSHLAASANVLGTVLNPRTPRITRVAFLTVSRTCTSPIDDRDRPLPFCRRAYLPRHHLKFFLDLSGWAGGWMGNTPRSRWTFPQPIHPLRAPRPINPAVHRQVFVEKGGARRIITRGAGTCETGWYQHRLVGAVGLGCRIPDCAFGSSITILESSMNYF